MIFNIDYLLPLGLVLEFLVIIAIVIKKKKTS